MTTNDALLRQLQGLHDQLSAMKADPQPSETVDERTIAALGQLVTDAQGLLEKTPSISEGESIDDEHGDLMDRVIEFESEHPRVAGFLNQMAELLAMMGI